MTSKVGCGVRAEGDRLDGVTDEILAFLRAKISAATIRTQQNRPRNIRKKEAFVNP